MMIRLKLFIALLLTAGLANAAPTTAPTESKLYKLQQYGVSLALPAGWNRLPQTEKGITIFAGKSMEPLNPGDAATMVLIEYQKSQQGSLQDFMTAVSASAGKKNDPKATVSAIEDATLGGEPAKRLTIVKEVKGILTRMMYLLADKDGHRYIFVANNPGKAEPMPTAIEKSFIFTD